MSGFLLGIDAGGTQLRARLFDPQQQCVIAHIQLPAAPDGGPEPLEGALLPYKDQCQAVCAGITKISRGDLKVRWERALHDWFQQASVCVVPDFVVAFHGAVAEGVGVLVVAGTGSVVYGEDGSGKHVRVGGRGWEYGDEGSGAHLTHDLLRRTLRACDGIYPPTPLTRLVCGALGTTEAGALAEVARQQALENGRGFLVPLVLSAAQSGEPEAKALFVGEAGWLARLVRTAHAQLGLESSRPFVVTVVGGMWEAGSLLRVPFEELLQRWVPQACLIEPVATPVEGAVQIAARTTR